MSRRAFLLLLPLLLAAASKKTRPGPACSAAGRRCGKDQRMSLWPLRPLAGMTARLPLAFSYSTFTLFRPS